MRSSGSHFPSDSYSGPQMTTEAEVHDCSGKGASSKKPQKQQSTKKEAAKARGTEAKLPSGKQTAKSKDVGSLKRSSAGDPEEGGDDDDEGCEDDEGEAYGVKLPLDVRERVPLVINLSCEWPGGVWCRVGSSPIPPKIG